MPIEAVKIPQNVYVEDRIVGPLTLRQVMIVALGGGGSYAIWSSLMKAYGQLSIVTTAIAWIPAVLSLAFAFIRINDLSLTHLLLLTAERMQKPAVRTWGPRTGIAVTIRTFKTEENSKADPFTAAQMQARENKLVELSTMLDQDANAQAAPVAEKEVDAPGHDAPPAPEPSPLPRIPVNPARVSVSEHQSAPGVDGIAPRSSIYSSRPAHA